MAPPVLDYIVPTKPSYKPVKTGYGYEVPHHGGSLEEIFGLGYNAPPKPAYHAPEPAYHAPTPAYHPPSHMAPPKKDYIPPKPVYHEPEPVYHAPEPAYAPPKPAYKPKSGHGYAPPHHGASLEEVFGLSKSLPERTYITPRPDYNPVTYKPKMPDYLHKDPGYVMHYLPYEDYTPHHPESLVHAPPVPHVAGAAHILVPGTHVLPELRMPHPHVRSMNLHHGARSKRSPMSGY